jgi:hypothetical protein
MMVNIYSAQSINFGINGSMKFSKFNRVGIGEFEHYRDDQKQIIIYSLNLDWEYLVNNYLAINSEAGYTFSTQNDFQGFQLGLYLGTNKLISFASLKGGILYIKNIPFRTPHNPISPMNILIASISIVKNIYKNFDADFFYQIPLGKKYVDETFVTTEFMNNLVGFGLQVDI